MLHKQFGTLAIHDRNAATAVISHHSYIPNDPHEESVYRLIPEEIHAPEKKARYRSKFSDQTAAEYKAGCKLMASMGPIKVHKERPSEFLKKHTSERAKQQSAIKTSQRVVDPIMPPVPKHNELSRLPAPTRKDFIKTNALDNIHSIPKKPKSPGPSYRTKKDYGKTPEYVTKRKQEAAEHAAANDLEEQMAEHNGGSEMGLVLLPEEERLRVLDGLKKNWDKLNSGYQKLSLTVDTVPKIARKVNMELQLKRLEDDIKKFSTPNVYVNFAE